MHICAKQYTFVVRGPEGCANRAISAVMYGWQECDPPVSLTSTQLSWRLMVANSPNTKQRSLTLPY